ncbi:MAG: LD-carboxypeptidase [bacterium]|nr:LD-carboxypeptidase [bacterium]
MKTNTLKQGDIIGIVAPSRPIYNIEKEIFEGIKNIRSRGFLVKESKFLNKKDYYSAGTITQRVTDLHEVFSDQKIKAVVCATGGATANQLLENLDFDLIKNNPKIFMGYSDITVLLLAINKKTNLTTFYGPNIREFSSITKNAKDFIFNMFEGKEKFFTYPRKGKVIKPGKASGELVGGLLNGINGLLGTPYAPDFSGKIIFWEEAGMCPAMIDLELQQLRLAGVFDKISGMVVGHLSDCIDKKYPKDNKSIDKIILERTKDFNFPIMKVDYFGHNTSNFYCLPIGGKALMDTSKKLLSVDL